MRHNETSKGVLLFYTRAIYRQLWQRKEVIKSQGFLNTPKLFLVVMCLCQSRKLLQETRNYQSISRNIRATRTLNMYLTIAILIDILKFDQMYR